MEIGDIDMKIISSVMVLCLFVTVHSLPAFAQDVQCPADPDALILFIQEAGICLEAAHRAEQCAWASSMDVPTTAAAQAVCESEYTLSNQSDSDMYGLLMMRCREKYAPYDGTMYRSLEAFCRLDVAKLFNELFTPLEDY